MRQLIVIVAAVLMCESCLKPAPITATVLGVRYVIPAAEVEAQDLKTPGQIFVRVAPGGDFHLILDEFFPYLPNKQGPDVPTISTLNDNRFGKFEVIATADGPIVCDLGPQPHFNCGINVGDGPVKWSVLFDRNRLAEAGVIRDRARSAIARYRQG